MRRVEGFDNLRFDGRNSAVVATPSKEYDAFLIQLQRKKEDAERIRDLEDKVVALDAKLDLILSLIQNKSKD